MPKLVERRWAPNPAAYGGWKQRAGFVYAAYVPDPIADLEIAYPSDLVELMSEAAAALAELHASPSLAGLEALSRQLLRSESIASSRIEGLELSQRRLAKALFDPDSADVTARSVIGNIQAMEAAIHLGEESRVITPADILAIHRTLMEATPDRAHAGRLREEQNWIGGDSTNPRNAEFIPPPDDHVPALLVDLCEFANREDVPAIAQAAVVHAQFETIHPFVDGNGRVGRALIHLLLRRRGLTPTFVPPISIVLATNAKVYVAGLTDFRNDNLIEWCRLFTAALRTAANHAASLGHRLEELQDSWRTNAGRPRRDSAAEKLIQALPARPIVDARVASEVAGVSYEAARLAVLALADAEVLKPIFVGRRRNRAWEAPEVVALLDNFEWEARRPPSRPNAGVRVRGKGRASPDDDAVVTEADALYGGMNFRFEWRKYQRMVLDLFEHRDPARRTFHIVSPPGSGKTLVGIEIARRIGRPAVTFSPTTTIQEQWRDKVRLFLPDDADQTDALALVSTDPTQLGTISSLTYQSLSTQTQEREFLDRLGLDAWRRELVEEGGRSDETVDAYLAGIGERSNAVYRRQLAKYAIRAKRRALATGQVDLHELLHPNAIDLVDRLVATGTGCVILDEAHHLLDYWALIIGDLITRLPTALVVGLTATPPASADPDVMSKYLKLVNGIDFEVPTPAVVRAGFLAPYQDLALFTQPTKRERDFLESTDVLLQEAITRMEDDARFEDWLSRRINRPDGDLTWTALLGDEFGFAVGGVRVMAARGMALADDIELRPGLRLSPTLDDRLAILRTWCLDVLRLSDDPGDVATLADLRSVLRTLGMVMTETGWRRAASPLDRVLAYSDSKIAGTVDILREESASMGDRLRAVVITDHERASATATRRLQGVLDEESGGAVRVIRALVADPATLELDPIMVTGRTVLVAERWAEACLAEMRAFFTERDLDVALASHAVEPGLVEIDGTGGAWRPRHYVAVVTDLLERGVTRCVVGTRGLLGEGWDSLSLNTLVDLTTAGTYASVNQIRGRSIRLDPADPHKVANNWDLVCYAPKLDEGDRDLKRLMGKHRHTWGLGSGDRILRGIGHVDERIALLDLPSLGPLGRPPSSVEQINRRALRRARNRADAYRRWGVGGEYDNFVFTGTILERPEKPLRTAFTLGKSLSALLNLAVLTLIYTAALIAVDGLGLALALPPPWNVLAFVALILVPVAVAAPPFWRYVKTAFIDLPVDSHLADFGRAVAEAYRSTGLAPMSPDQVRVRVNESATYDVVLDSRDKAMVDQFAASYAELFEPIVDQRYLTSRNEGDISGTFYAPIWYVLRAAFAFARRGDTAYHAVPTVFGRRRETADAFAIAWRRWVGGGELVYTRSPDGMEVLLRERVALRTSVRAVSVDEWR